jgi:hypothetical protein
MQDLGVILLCFYKQRMGSKISAVSTCLPKTLKARFSSGAGKQA